MHAVYHQQLADKGWTRNLRLFMPTDRRYLLGKLEKAIGLPLTRSAIDLAAFHGAGCPTALLRLAPQELNLVIDDLEKGRPRQSIEELERIEQHADTREDVSQVDTLVQSIPTDFAIRERIRQLKASMAAQADLVRAYEWELAEREALNAAALRRAHAR